MRVGFSGTRDGMTDAQKTALTKWVCRNMIAEWHHGNALGADEEAVMIVADWLVRRPPVIAAHPSDVPESGSASAYILSHEKHPPKRPLVRNWDIVDASAVLLATPAGPEEVRSEVWATIRYARKLARHIVIIWPDGSTTEENPPATPLSPPSETGRR